MPIRLDERLTAIAGLIDYGKVADVGCDHGKLGYYLIGTDRASLVIATDISEGSLKKARELAYDNGVTDVMQTRLGDGLKPVADREVDSVVIAGLGGDVISGILAGAREDGKRFSHYVLSPNTHPEKVREEILRQSHKIVCDRTVECGGKRYTLIKTEEGEETLDKYQIAFGKFYADDNEFETLAKGELAYKQNLYASHKTDEIAARIEFLKEALDNLSKKQI